MGTFFPSNSHILWYFIHRTCIRVFSSIFHSTKKCKKTHRLERTWEIGTHTFPVVWVLFSHSIAILWYTSLHGKCMSFPNKKCNKTHCMGGEDLGNWYSHFSHRRGAFFHWIPILWYSSLYGKYIGFLINIQ